jgi:soluble lytic murein transglycosylase-like protein
MQAQPTPNPALAAAVRAGHWVEVRTLAASLPRPLPPAVALVVARAARALGEPDRALALLRAALPDAGELAAALRLEAADAMLALGQDPSPEVAPLLAAASPPAYQRTAADCLRRAWDALPVAVLRRSRQDRLPATLRRELAVRLAIRSSDETLVLHVLAERSDDQSAFAAAEWLAARPGLPPSTTLAVAETLLRQGAWRQAERLLVLLPPPTEPAARFRLAFLRGRAAYRLGTFVVAAGEFDRALALATSDEQRFSAVVQRARVAEIDGDYPAALGFWKTARTARPLEPEGWDGSARTLVALGRAAEAVALLARCPHPALRIAGPRLGAILLLHHDPARARAVLARLPRHWPVARVLQAALLVQVGDPRAATSAATRLLADARAGAWREQVLDVLHRSPEQGGQQPLPTRKLAALARIATSRGLSTARGALASALTTDPRWAPVLSGSPSAPASWTGAAPSLAAVGLEHEAAAIYPHTFPGTTPQESAWSARTLAAWGNRTAALSYGEHLWAQLGPIPAVLLPEGVLSAILPTELIGGCVAAAKEHGIPAPWLVAIIRQESRFDPDARSMAGAVGVAQLVPETVRRQGVTLEEVRNQNRAPFIAAREVARLAETFGPRLEVVAAAYNAGETVVTSWLAQFGAQSSGALFAAAIPYGETAGYVLAVSEGVALARYSK